MKLICTVGEILVEIMRKEKNASLSKPGLFLGPYPSGAPAIFADALAKLGIPCALIGSVGNDAFGRCIIDRLQSDGVDTSQIQTVEDRTTGMAFVTYNDDGNREFLFHIGHSAAVQVDVQKLSLSLLERIWLLHISGTTLAINKNMCDLCLKLAKMVKERGGLVTFDLNVRRELLGREELQKRYFSLLSFCDYILPSQGEAEFVTGCCDLSSAVQFFLERGIRGVILKRAEKGCELFTPDGHKSYPGFPVEEVDPTGAGDCFNAGFVYGLANEWSWDDTLTFANAMGALAVRKQGPMEGAEELSVIRRFISSYPQID